jgi:hypothetical protein
MVRVRTARATRLGLAGAVLMLAGQLAGCSDPAPSAREEPPSWRATFEQDRPDYASRDAHVKLTNIGRAETTVEAVRVRWSGYRAGPWLPADMTYAPGHVHRLDVRLPVPRCDRRPAGPPGAQIRVTDGRTFSVPFDAAGTERLRQIWAQACREVRLRAAVRVGLEDWRPVHRDGLVVMRADLVARRGGSAAEVRLVATRGSVLLDLRPLGSRRVLLPRGSRTGRIPVEVTSAGRCDPHSVGQSTQTFTLKVWVSLDGGPEQPLVTIPDARTRARLQDVIATGCGLRG